MKEIEKLAFNVVTNFLNIKKDDAVSIYAEIFDEKYQNPLSEIPLMEEIAFAIRKRAAFPLLEVTTQQLQQRFFNELSDEILGLVPKYFLDRIDSLAAFLEIGWKALGNPFENEDVHSKVFYKTVSQILKKIHEKKKKIVYLNYPSEQLAHYIQTDFNVLLNNYFALVNCDYELLDKRAEELKFFFENNEKIKIQTKAGELQFIINSNETKLFYQGENGTVILPTGKAEIPIRKLFLKGDFFAEKIFYKDKIYNDVSIQFKDGFIVSIDIANSTSKESFTFKNNLIGAREEVYFSYGFNNGGDNYSGFYSYDRNLFNAVSLKFYDHSFNPIIMINKNNKNNIEGV